MSAQWKRLPTSGDPPSARAYHTMTCIGSRYLLFGGFDGKLTFGDLWWLVPEGTIFSFQYNLYSAVIYVLLSFVFIFFDALETCKTKLAAQ